MLKWPLPEEEWFGFSGSDKSHTGKESISDHSALRAAQLRLDKHLMSTGIFDNPTFRAVTKFQQQNGLLVHGRLDKYTWEHLFKE